MGPDILPQIRNGKSGPTWQWIASVGLCVILLGGGSWMGWMTSTLYHLAVAVPAMQAATENTARDVSDIKKSIESLFERLDQDEKEIGALDGTMRRIDREHDRLMAHRYGDEAQDKPK